MKSYRIFNLFISVLLGLLIFNAPLSADGLETLHPEFIFLDAKGNIATDKSGPVSIPVTCGQCHDTVYIDSHNIHHTDKVQVSCVQCHFKDGNMSDTPGNAHSRIQLPTPKHCVTCHGIIQVDSHPVTIPGDYLDHFNDTPGQAHYNLTQRTGVIFAQQNISKSALNIKDKDNLDFGWDIHARRQLDCMACHFTRNDPRTGGIIKSPLDHLTRDPRRIRAPYEYLKWPDHRLESADCTFCHNTQSLHKDMPYEKRHLEVLECSACHVPKVYGPALKSVDHTVLTAAGKAVVEFRGVEESKSHGNAINTKFFKGFKPFLFAGENKNKEVTFAPYNLITRWTWKSADTGLAVPIDTLKKVYFNNSAYRKDIISLFDGDKNNRIDDHELILDSGKKLDFIKSKLIALGIENPAISGTVEAHKIHHGVINVKQMTRDCSLCHSRDSQLSQTIDLSHRTPFGTTPRLLKESPGFPLMSGRIASDKQGLTTLTSIASNTRYYIFGHSRIKGFDTVGLWIFLISILFVLIHGGMRYYSYLKHPLPHADTERVYMYRFYERLWHWTMATGVIILAITGLEIHYPSSIHILGLETAVRIHNILAVILVVNAALSLFYHLVTGEIKQFFRFNRKFIHEKLVQIYYYTYGIFKHEPHPISKSVERKLNPLQQLVYIFLLNILLPFQVITGASMWAVGQWPETAAKIGGLSYLAPIHNFGSWLFLSFLVVHIYLTTTGHTPMANIKAMITGYDDITQEEASQEHLELMDMKIMDLAGTLIGKLTPKSKDSKDGGNDDE
jgi:thiosulfate reductase cytochrome b subunit